MEVIYLVSGNISVNNNTNTLISSINPSNTKKNQVWNCTIRVYDGIDYSNTNSTSVFIINAPPILLRYIEGRNWLNYTNITLNLTQYFSDIEGDTLTYSATSAENFTISINQTSGIATLASVNGIVDEAYINFIVSDGINNTYSNSILIESHYDITISSNQTWSPTKFLEGIYYYRNVVINNNATLTMEGNYTNNTNGYGVTLNATGNLTIELGSSISAEGKGYKGGSINGCGEGPGGGCGANWPSQPGGGAYGGDGGSAYGGVHYGELFLPVRYLGSGGEGGSGTDATSGGNGGGAITLIVGETLYINGSIKANGQSRSTAYNPGAGGSGGSIYIDAYKIKGTGNITAKGGNGAYGSQVTSGNGGGGRIIIYFYDSYDFTGTISVEPGNGGVGGEKGTSPIIDKKNNDLYIKNSQHWKQDTDGEKFNFRNMLVYNNSTLYIESTYSNDYDGNTTIFNLENFTLEDGSYIDLSGLGYKGGNVGGDGDGPGGGSGSTWPDNPGGGSYGGVGGGGGAPTYGLYYYPIELGSGGEGGAGSNAGSGGNGGGAIFINASKKVILNGSINASGKDGNIGSWNPGAGGSGGSIFIISESFIGNGYLEARGGNGAYGSQATSGNGGGGRIAVIYKNDLSWNFTHNSTDPGTGGLGGNKGSEYFFHYYANITFNISSNHTTNQMTINISGKAQLTDSKNVSNVITIKLNNTQYYYNATSDTLVPRDTGILPSTNSTGDFYYKIEPILKDGVYNLTINTSDVGIYGLTYGKESVIITVLSNNPPKIISNSTIPTRDYYDSNTNGTRTYITCDVFDLDFNLVSVNFTIIAPNGSVVIDNKNASVYYNNIWNSSYFVLNQYGQWNYSIVAWDDRDNNDTTYGYIRFLQISENLEPYYANFNQSVAVFGNIKDSQGNNVANQSVFIYLNDAALIDWWNSSWYYRKLIYIESNVSSNLSNLITFVNFSTIDLINESKMRNDCGDIRFTDLNNNELQYTMETSTCNSTNTIFWVWTNLTGLSNNSIYAYYGNPSATLKTDYSNPDDSLILYLHFDNSSAYGENNAKVFDFSKKGNNGTCSDTYCPTYYQNGKNGGHFYFDGNNDYFNMGSITNSFTKGITISLWTNISSVKSWARFIDFGESGASNDNILFGRKSTSNDLFFEVYNGGSSGGQVYAYGTLSLNNWLHLVATQNSTGHVKIYVNGILAGTGSTAIPQNVIRATSYIGKSNWVADSYFHGYIDELRIYNRTLSADEISAIYNATKPYFIKDETWILTNSSGNYYFSFNAPLLPGQYVVKVNATYNDEYGEQTQILTVKQFPKILSNNTVPNNAYFDSNNPINVHLQANISDDNLVSVNFTLIAPNGSVVIDNKNASAYYNNIWNSSHFVLNQYGQWNYSIIAIDNDNNNDTTYGYIRFLQISENLEPYYANSNQSVAVFGNIKDSQGNNVVNQPVSIYLNDSLLIDWWNSSWYYRKLIYIESNVSSNLSNLITFVNFSTIDLINESKMRNDCGDIRFTDLNNNELQYTMETSTCNSTNTIFWVWTNLTGLSNNSIYAYYGNPSATLKTDYSNPDDSLILYLHFDNSSAYGENNAKVFDFSKKGNNGTIIDNPYPTNNGKTGNGFYFDGVNDYINILDSDSLDISDSITILVWIYPQDTTSEYDRIITKPWETDSSPWNVYAINRLANTQKYGFYVGFEDSSMGGSVSTSEAPLNQWTFLAGVYNGTNTKIYFNGKLEASNYFAKKIKRNSKNIAIGGNSYNREFYKGIIDEIRIYNRTLSEDEISAIYNATKPYFIKDETWILTNSSGNYYFSFNAPLLPGQYVVKVNATYNDEYGEQTQILTVKQVPKILSNNTVPNKVYFDSNNPINVYLQANISDDNLLSVNFTLIAPNGSVVIDNKNASAYSNNIWNSSHFVLNQYGQWNYSIIAIDNDNNNDTTYGYIRFLQISENLEPYYANFNQSVAVFGNIKDSQGNNVVNQPVSIYLNDSVLIDWWNPSWSYRKNIIISENSNTTLNNYQINLSVDTQSLINLSKMKSDCSDIRFIDSYNNELSYYIESGCNSNSTIIWVKVNLTAGINNTIFMYYGNDLAESKSNITNVYDLYDDFEDGSINTNLWTTIGNVVETNGYIYIEVNNNGIYGIQSKSNFSVNSIVEFGYQVYGDRGAQGSMFLGFYNISTPTYNAGGPTNINMAGFTEEILAIMGNPSNYQTQATGYSRTSNLLFDPTWIKWFNNKSILYTKYEDNTSYYGILSSYPPSSQQMSVLFSVSDVNSGYGPVILYLYYVKVRKFVENYPTFSIIDKEEILTNSSGNYYYSFNAPLLPGQYVVKVNATYNDEYGEQTQILTVKQVPKILSNNTVPNKVYFDSNNPINVYLQANISDDNLLSVNFTLIAPNGSVVIDNKNASAYSNNIWNSSHFVLNQYGQWNYSIIAIDNDNNNDTTYGYIRFLQISENLEPYYANFNQSVAVFGNIKDSQGNNVVNQPVSIYLNDSVLIDWWNPSWSYRKNIIISENSNTTLNNYQINLSVDTQSLINLSKMKSDCSDIRFIDSYNNELSYYIESGCNSNSTIIWVKVNLTAGINNTIFMYYGNDLAESKSNITNVYDLYDDFEDGSINTNLWTTIGNVVETNGYIYIEVNNNGIYGIQSKSNFSVNSIVEFGYQVYGDRGAQGSMFLGFYNISTPTYNAGGPTNINMAGFTEEILAIMGNPSNYQTQATGYSRTSNLLFDPTWIKWFNNKSILYTKYEDNTSYYGILSSYPPSSQQMSVLFSVSDVNSGYGPVILYLYYVKVRKFVENYPTFSIIDKEEILTNSSGNYYYSFNAPLLPGQYVVKVNATYNDEYGEQTQILSVVENTNPQITNIYITPELPKTSTNLECVAIIDSYTNVSVEYFWYNGSDLILSGNNTNVLNNIPQVITTLDSSYTKKGERWNCTIRAYNGIYYSSYNSTEVIIQNSPPSTPMLISPTNNNNSVWTNPPIFIWTSNDDDNDLLNFTLNITSQICPDIGTITNITAFNYTPEELELNCPYEWQVMVSDGINYSNWSERWNFSIEPILILTLLNNSIDFGNLKLNDIMDTDNNISPFIIRNDGNILANITYISINQSLWSSVSDNTEYFQFKVDNVSSEPNSFNWSESTTIWTNLSLIDNTNKTAIAYLKYQDNNDEAQIDIRVKVPPSESAGEKKSTIIIIGEDS
ncbi:MAG: hypothetical protein KatS3mg002_1643 [Candidatus Woesearchaeota archaeon]|nr:MAG: hypothetical protein KatS3mg002_1643 [Candidatus Woesearchaeota archaeon]